MLLHIILTVCYIFSLIVWASLFYEGLDDYEKGEDLFISLIKCHCGAWFSAISLCASAASIWLLLIDFGWI